jgi:steroid 5-alpha reductase family enzyme
MMPWRLLLTLWLAAAVMMTLGWAWQQRHRNAGIVDVLWSAGLAGGAVLNAVFGAGAPVPRAMVGVLGGVWGARLAVHLGVRVRGEPAEDGRYRALRGRWGNRPLKWFCLFQFQALLIALFAIPFAAAATNSDTRPPWLALGLAIWLIGVGGESLADRQLARFRADSAHRGQTCRAGLWRYSRHPNYFFEWLHWFSYVALAVGAPCAGYSLLGPALMYVFLRWISGVPYTEAQTLRTRGGEYREYQRTTSVLIPWRPRPASGNDS